MRETDLQSQQISVLIADPSHLFADALSMALWWTPEFNVLTDFADSGPRAIEAIVRAKPDVAVMDYFMPELEAPGVIQAVVEKKVSTKVLVTSLFPGRPQIASSLEVGAAGFLPKSMDIARVVDAILRAHGGELPVFRDQLDKLLSTLEAREEQDLQNRLRLSTLTVREKKLLQMLSKGMSNAEIAKALKISPATVKRHFYNVITKTEARTKEEALAMARAAGVIRR